MATRITRTQLQTALDGLNRDTGINFTLDHAACYGGYVVVDETGHRITSERNNAAITYKLIWAYREGYRQAKADIAALILTGGRA